MPVRMRRILMVVLVATVAAWGVYAMGQPGRPKGGGKGPGPGIRKGGAPDQNTNVLNVQFLLSEKVKSELQITDDQANQIRSLSERFHRRMLGMSSPRGGKSEEMTGLLQEFDTELGEILQPGQLERFKQLLVRQELQKDTVAALTGTSEIAKTLGVTDDQKRLLRAAAREGEEDVRQGIEKLREDARQKIIDALTPEQRDQLAKMMGEKFEISPPRNGKRGGPSGPGSQGPPKGKMGVGKPNGRP